MTNLYLRWLIKRFIKGKVVQKLGSSNGIQTREPVAMTLTNTPRFFQGFIGNSLKKTTLYRINNK